MQKEIQIPIQDVLLSGIFKAQEHAKGLVIFAHGSGSSRLSPRNNAVADILNKAGFATLLFDLLTEEEDQIYENRFNIELLAQRLNIVTKWVRDQKELGVFESIGYFGASTGAAAALIAAANDPSIKAVVSRGGRPDLAGDSLPKVKAPTLLIVGGDDTEVISLNKEADRQLTCERKVHIVPGATHLFEEPGTLEEVSKVAAEWFEKYIS